MKVPSPDKGGLRQMLQQAFDLHRQGRTVEAEAGYRSVLARDPAQFDALHLFGLLRLQQGQASEAHDLVAAALKQQPNSSQAQSTMANILTSLGRRQEALSVLDALLARNSGDIDARYNRAVVAAAEGRVEQALADYDRVLSARPKDAQAWFNRGNLLAAIGRDADALSAYEQVLSLAPKLADAQLNRGNVLSRLKRHADALGAFERVLAVDPRHVDALNGRAIALREMSRHEEAQAACEQALALKPDHAGARITLGNMLLARGDLKGALAQFERVLTTDPKHPDALHNKGFALAALRRPAEAIECYDLALRVRPRNADALNSRAIALASLDRRAEALASYDAALAIEPNHADVLANRAQVLSKMGRSAEAIADCERALAINPRHRTAIGDLASCQLAVCDWTAALELPARLDNAVSAGDAVVPPFVYVALPISAADHLRYTKAYLDRLPKRGVAPPRHPSRVDRRADDRIRIAYLSADYYRHPTAWLAVELFERHDRSRFEIIGISYGPDDNSDIRHRLVSSFDRFHDVRSRTDSEVADLLFELKIDIAVDLKGHTEHARPGILASRPAPVQVSYLGYPGTTALDFIDYVVADPVVLPFDQQSCFTEKIVHLPECYQPNDSRKAIAPQTPSRSELGLPEQGVVFCCFNQSYKITREFFDAWMRLLQSCEGSVLWLLDSNDTATANLRKEAQSRGVDPARLVFAPKQDLPRHLARHRAADLFLDNLPCNAHTTASDALWAGLPVLTCIGTTFAGRVAASLLQAVGLPELVTHDLGAYEALAGKLAADPAFLKSFRERLAANRSTHPLFNSQRTCRHIEAAYTRMWETWLRGEAPRSFAVSPLPD